MKKIILIILSIIYIGYTFGISQEKLNYLKGLNINIDKNILNKKQISRYEASRYLSYAECFDCLNTVGKRKQKYNYGWFSNFKKQDNFYLNDIDPQDTYYYCVVSLASKNYIHGYPYTNPICGGNFCGSNSLTYSELYQITTNIISNKIANKYNIDNVDKFYTNIMSIKGTQIGINYNLTEGDYKIAKDIKDSGENPYQLKNFDEFYMYEKYCNIYPEDCGFKEFGEKIKKGNYSLSIVNILYNENILTLKDIENYNPTKLVDGETLIKWLYKVKKLNACSIDTDYDKDGIPDKDDNCPSTYNPNQKDLDKDGIGNVCDDDIDGDGIKNPVGIVDDKDNIIQNKITKNMDNCLFTKNSEQIDINHNGIGSKCENKGNGLVGIEINCNPLVGEANLNTNCNAKTTGPVKKIVWTYNGKVIGEGTSIPYTFTKAGKKKIIATAIGKNNDTATSYNNLQVNDKANNVNGYQVGLQIFPNPNSGPIGTKVTFTPKFKGDLDKISWNFGDSNKNYIKKPTTKPIKTYNKAGIYTITAKGYKNHKVVSISSTIIHIYKNGAKNTYSYYLKSNILLANKNQEITFTIVPTGFTQKDVKNIVWNFKDGTTKNSTSLSYNHSYSKAGAYPVKAKIFLKDGSIIDNVITQKVIDNNNLYGGTISSDKIKANIGEKITFTIHPKGFEQKDIKNIVCSMGDGTTKNINSLSFTYTYYKSNKFPVNCNIALNNGSSVNVGLTQIVVGNNICLTKNNGLKCDMDKDGIPNMCDNDIDGDGVKNLLGIIKFEKKDCSIDNENIDKKRFDEETNLAKKGQDIDNCLFTKNSEQIDINHNGIGDKCENKGNDLIGIEINCNPLVGEANLNTNCNANTTGPVKKIVWTYNGKVIGEGTSIPYTFTKAGKKKIIATAIGKNNDTATAYNNLQVNDKNSINKNLYGGTISSDKIKANIGEEITFTIHRKGFDQKDIKNIVCSMGDGTTKNINSLSFTYTYHKSYTFPVNCNIALNDGASVNVGLTQVVIGTTPTDSDNDGIPDKDDYCPNIPENYNGISDKDGCPETEVPENKLTLKVDNCNSCPCQFADYKSAFLPGMFIQAILVNPNNPSQIYKYSKEKIVK